MGFKDIKNHFWIKQLIYTQLYSLRILSIVFIVYGTVGIIYGLFSYYVGYMGLDDVIAFYSALFIVLMLAIIFLLLIQYIVLIRFKKRSNVSPILNLFYRTEISDITIYGFIILMTIFAAVILFFMLLKYPNFYYLNVLYILLGAMLYLWLIKF